MTNKQSVMIVMGVEYGRPGDKMIIDFRKLLEKSLDGWDEKDLVLLDQDIENIRKFWESKKQILSTNENCSNRPR